MTATSAGSHSELHTIPLSSINIEEGFNPRESYDARELAKLADSVRQHGLLQPIEVAPAGSGEYRLIAGHRRYLACGEAALVEVPALVRYDVDEAARGLDHAIIENVLRADLNPVEEARAYRRLMDDAGLTRRGVAERCSVSQRRVTERLQILDVPEALHARIADGMIPASAVKALGELAKIHPELPSLAYKRVTAEPLHQWDEPTTWSDFCEDPIGVVIGRYAEEAAELPPGVYDVGGAHPVASFRLSEKAAKELAKLCELRGCDPEGYAIRFEAPEIEHAQKIGAAFPPDRGYVVVIVGQDVADELAADVIKRALKAERKRARELAEWQAQRGGATDGTDGLAQAGVPASEEELREQRRPQREADAEARRQASAYNDELGIAIVKTLSKTKVDERVVKVLAAVDFDGEFEKLAMRGARYGFPGWVDSVTVKEGKAAKRVYLESREAGERARTYLAAAKTAPDYAGRLLALVAMAHLADENAVAQSKRSFYSLSFGSYHGDTLPWSREVLSLVEELAIERLPEHLTERLRERRAEREACEAERLAADESRQAAIAELRGRLPELAAEERRAAVFALQDEHGWDVAFSDLHGEVRRLEQSEAAAALEAEAEEADRAPDDDEVLDDAFVGAEFAEGAGEED